MIAHLIVDDVIKESVELLPAGGLKGILHVNQANLKVRRSAAGLLLTFSK
jgi:hypothetical protein